MIYTVLLALPVFAAEGTPTYFIATDYWPPYRIHNSVSEIGGIDRDIMDEVARRMNVRFVWLRRPWARCLSDMEKGEVDIMTGIAKSPEREAYIRYSAIPYDTCAPAFYVKRGHLSRSVVRYKDLQGLRIGFVRDSVYFPQFDADTSLRKIPGNTEDQLVRMLMEKRFDVIIGTDCQVEYDIKLRGLESQIVRTQYVPPKKSDLYIGVSRRSQFQERLSDLNLIIEMMKADGTIARIKSKYVGDKQ